MRDNNTTLEKLDINVYKKFSEAFENDIYDAIDLINCVNKRNVVGGSAAEQVVKQIKLAENKLKI